MKDNPGPNVGQRIRTLRDRQNLSLRALAERCGLSFNAISQIERGENSPTVSSLHRLATALHVPITDFFQEEDRQAAVFVKRDQALQSESDGIRMESLGIGLLHQQLVPFRMNLQPRAGNTEDPITHPGEEFVHCIEGQIEYWVGSRVFRLGPGDSLLFEATQPHACCNPTPHPASLLLVIQAVQDTHLARQLHLEA